MSFKFGKKSIFLTIFLTIGIAIAIPWFKFLFSLEKKFPYNGKIDDYCCCNAELLRRVNNEVVPITLNLSETLFFRIFRVNLENECPFWAQKLMCTAPTKCGICKCQEDEIPLSWRNEKQEHISKRDPVSIENKDFFAQWETHKLTNKLEWHVEEKENDNGVFINLPNNPEAFTGYQGQQIWHYIYSENCFKGNMEDMCSEERLFIRTLSGLHTSISTQLSYYYIDEKNKTYPNIPMFFEKVGNHPERILNLYFAYSVVLRAIRRAENHIKNYEYDTGDLQNDLDTKKLIDKLYRITTDKCDYAFNETELFSDITKEQTKKQFISYFHNISRIMDCVECEKCKVYGKMQTYGIAAAFKILFSEKLEGVGNIHLKRNELIALINTFNKLSTSIDFVDKMFYLRYELYWAKTQMITVCLLAAILFCWISWKIYTEKMKKIGSGLKVIQDYQKLVKKEQDKFMIKR